MADAELVARCMEEIAATVLDAGDAISYRTLGASSHVSADVSRHALHKFAQENESTVGAIEVRVQHGVADPNSASTKASVDPRARVIRIGSFSPQQSDDRVISTQIYSVYKKAKDSTEEEEDVVEPISVACWSQERSLRNDIFQKVTKQAPLSRAIKAFYESGIKCAEATTRTGFGDSQGEESVSIFDSLKASAKPATVSSTSAQSAASNGSKSFFKSTASSASSSAKPRATSSVTSSAKPTPAAAKHPETKKIDAKSMSNVFTIDSDDDDDDDGSDADAPVFVKKKTSSGGAAKPRSKRVISDDEDEDEDEDANFEARKPAKTPAKSKTRRTDSSSNASSSARNVKRKLNASPAAKNHATLSDSDEPKRANPIDDDVDDNASDEAASADQEKEEEEEEEEEPAEISTVRRVEVTKTRINEQGYMVTEKTYEEVKLTAEEVEQERLEAAKKKKQQQAAKAAAEAAKAAAEKKAAAAAAKGGAPPKQKNLFAFFQRK